jgi:hypothetical protein
LEAVWDGVIVGVADFDAVFDGVVVLDAVPLADFV